MASVPALGLYFSDDWLVLAGVDRSGKWVERFGRVRLPSGVLSKGEILDSMALAGSLEELKNSVLPKKISTGQSVVLGVTEQKVFLREFVVPKVVGKLEDVVDSRVRAILPTLPEEMVTDWQILGEDDQGQILALLIAVPKQVLENLVKVVESVGFKVVGVESMIMALVREIRPELLKSKDQLFVYQASSGYVMAYLANGRPRFSTVVRQDEIEKQGSVVKLVGNTINFVNSKHQGREIKELLVASETGESEAIVAALGGLGLPVVKAQTRLVGTRVEGVMVMQAAVGLAMAGLYEDEKVIDLMPESFRSRDRINAVGEVWRLSVLMMVVVSMLLAGALFYWHQMLVQEKVVLASELTSWQQGAGAARRNELSLQVRSFNALFEELNSASQIIGGGGEVMRQLDQASLSGIRLTGLLYERGKGIRRLDQAGGSWMVTGVAQSRRLVLDFYDELITHEAFADGKLYFGSLEKDSEVVFRVVGGNSGKK